MPKRHFRLMAVTLLLAVVPATIPAMVAADAALPGVVEIPGRSRMEHRPQVSETFRIDITAAHQPLFEAVEGGVACE